MTAEVDSAIAELTPLPMYPGYSADITEGQILGKRGKPLKPTENGQVSVSIEGLKSTVNVSWLIWSAVYGELPEAGIEYRDGNPANNRLDNLVAAGGRHKPSRYCTVNGRQNKHLLLADECATFGFGNRVCRRCLGWDLPKVLPIVQTYSAAYGTGRPPEHAA
jgi:HNH endonuclease